MLDVIILFQLPSYLVHLDWILVVIAKLFCDHIFNSKENVDGNLNSLENGSEVI